MTEELEILRVASELTCEEAIKIFASLLGAKCMGIISSQCNESFSVARIYMFTFPEQLLNGQYPKYVRKLA